VIFTADSRLHFFWEGGRGSLCLGGWLPFIGWDSLACFAQLGTGTRSLYFSFSQLFVKGSAFQYGREVPFLLKEISQQV
jgi:hypothetical protein